METRRGFLKLLGSLMVTTAAEEVFGKTKQAPANPQYTSEYDIYGKAISPL